MKDITIRSSEGQLVTSRGEIMRDVRSGTVSVMTESGELTFNWDNVFYIYEKEASE